MHGGVSGGFEGGGDEFGARQVPEEREQGTASGSLRFTGTAGSGSFPSVPDRRIPRPSSAWENPTEDWPDLRADRHYRKRQGHLCGPLTSVRTSGWRQFPDTNSYLHLQRPPRGSMQQHAPERWQAVGAEPSGNLPRLRTQPGWRGVRFFMAHPATEDWALPCAAPLFSPGKKISLHFQTLFLLMKVIQSPQQISQLIRYAWEDRTSFEEIKERTGLTECEIIDIMRRELKPSSFRLWRKRVSGRITKHRRLLEQRLKGPPPGD